MQLLLRGNSCQPRTVYLKKLHLSRFRKQVPKEPKQKEVNQGLNDKSRRESLTGQTLDAPKANSKKMKEAKELALKDLARDDRDSRSPSPACDLRSSEIIAGGKENQMVAPEARDASWFGGEIGLLTVKTRF